MREEWTPKCRIYTLLSFFWVHLCYTWAAAAGDLLLGNHCVCPGAQRIGKEFGREVQWCFQCYFGLASLKWGKKSAGMKWQFTLVALRKMGRKTAKHMEWRNTSFYAYTHWLSFLTVWAEVKSILWSLSRRKVWSRFQSYGEILFLKNSINGRDTSVLPVHLAKTLYKLLHYFCVQRHTSIFQTKPRGLSARCRALMKQQMLLPTGTDQPCRLDSAAWKSVGHPRYWFQGFNLYIHLRSIARLLYYHWDFGTKI